MPVSMNGASAVAVCVDMACDDRFTAYRCIKQIIFQCRFVVVFIVIVLAVVVHHGRAPPHLHGDEESHGCDCARARRASADRAMRNGKPAAKGNEGEARDCVDDMAETLRECGSRQPHD